MTQAFVSSRVVTPEGVRPAAVVVEESKLEGVWLAETIAALLQDSSRLQRMSAAARSLAHPNAARDIAAMAARVAGIEEADS